MTEWGVIGVFVSLVGLFATIYKLVFQPMNELNTTIRVLIQRLANSEELDRGRDVRLGEHRGELIRHRDCLSDHDKRIDINAKDIEDIKNTTYMKDRLD